MRSVAIAAGLAAALLLSACERPPVVSVQRGYRGTGMEQVYNPRLVEKEQAKNAQPEILPPASNEGPRARDVYQNVPVLGHLSVAEFTRTMQAMTAWVSPKEGCAYCHNLQNLADDSRYQKVVSRRMVQMTQHINVDWQKHVAQTGVTCYTCHRGENIPSNVWFKVPPQHGSGFVGYKAGQNAPAPTTAYASLPNDPFSPFLANGDDIRIVSGTALPAGNVKSIKQTENTYGLMMHMSQALGVNCTYCHNSRSFVDWEQSTPQRAVAWSGIRMVRDVNTNYLLGLQSSFPVNRLGPTGDVAKTNCTTCHQGAFKPLYGAATAHAFPALIAAGPGGFGVVPARVAAAMAAASASDSAPPPPAPAPGVMASPPAPAASQ